MRFAFVPWIALLAIACVEDEKVGPDAAKCSPDNHDVPCEPSEPEANACALGQNLHSATLSALKLSAPSCTRDSECVAISTAIDCRGVVRIDLCEEVMHRDAAAQWDPQQLCARILAHTPDNGLSCAIDATCRGAGLPRCRGGECVPAHL